MRPKTQIKEAITKAFLPIRSERRKWLFDATLPALLNNFEYWLGGMDNDVLAEFPAQRLIRVTDEPEPVNWKQHWPSAGGKLYGGAMVSLKWDAVWFRISFLNLPFPPFQLGSWYEVEDVDRDEAKRLGFHVPPSFNASVKIALNTEDIRQRCSLALERWELDANKPPILQ